MLFTGMPPALSNIPAGSDWTFGCLAILPFLLPFPFYFPTSHTLWDSGGMMKRHGGNVLGVVVIAALDLATDQSFQA
jgi:hypothetical protein